MHILFLTDNFPPEVNAPATRTYEHCTEWIKSGHKVTVITCAPNFPHGKVFKGYRNALYTKEHYSGIDIIRVWSFIARNQGTLYRILDYLSFMLSAIMASFFIRNIDIIIGTSPQFFTVCATSVISKIRRRPWIFELRDFWPDSIVAVGAMRESLIIQFLRKIEKWLYLSATHLVVVTRSFQDELISRGIDPGKISIITNGVSFDGLFNSQRNISLREELNLSGKFVVGYIGTHGLAHSLETILAAADAIRHSQYGQNVVFIFLGDGAEKNKLITRASELNLKNVIFLDTVPRELISDYWSILDVTIIHLRKNALFNQVIPSKLFEAMAMGIPILHGVPGESTDIVLANKVGEEFTPEDHQSLCEAIIRMKSDAHLRMIYSENGRRVALQFERSRLASDMLNVIKRTSVEYVKD